MDIPSGFAEPDINEFFTALTNDLPEGAIVPDERCPTPPLYDLDCCDWGLAAARRAVEKDSRERLPPTSGSVF